MATGLLVVCGVGAAVGSGQGDAASVGLGAGAAWAVQGASFWPLAEALRRGRPALRIWVAGMTARGAGLAAVALAFPRMGLERRDGALTYALGLLVLLWSEGLWLWKGGAVTRPAGTKSRKTKKRGKRTDDVE